jgi:NAD(P) transhydrogenase subunit alpha
MKIGILKDSKPGERRVALVPESIVRIKKKGVDVVIEQGAGVAASFPDSAYNDVGATIESSGAAVMAACDVAVRINTPTNEELDAIPEGKGIVSLMFPLSNPELVKRCRDRKLTAIALDRIPRITLAQSMDVLSSQSNVAGYRAVIVASQALPKMFPLMMTAAGRLNPAKVMILGAGVAGLQAIATARRLGALVEAYDVRTVVKEQVESLGATFIDTGIEQDDAASGGYAKETTADEQTRINEVIADHLADTDVCITTALIPGRPAPKLLTADMARRMAPGSVIADMARRMAPGSVIVDLAAEQGGNCELTQAGETIEVNGILILGPTNLPSEVAHDASQMFSRNVEKLLLYMVTKEGGIEYDFTKDIVAGCVFTHGGEIKDSAVAESVTGGSQ